MLKRLLCEAVMTWELSCQGPLLIADGRFDDKMRDHVKNKFRRADEKNRCPDQVFISHANLQTI